MPASNRNPQRGQLVPALREFQREWQGVQAAVRAAGNSSSEEATAGHDAPSPESITRWEEVVDAVSRLLAGALHFADGGAYNATGVTTGSADTAVEAGQHTDTQPVSEQSAPHGDAPAAAAEQTPNGDQELFDFSKAVRERFPEAAESDCVSALELFHNAHMVKATPLRFTGYPGFTGASAYELLRANFGAMPTVERVPRESNVDWHRRVWDVTTSGNLVRTFSFINPDVVPQLGEYVTEMDVIAQYLGAARSVELPDGAPEEITDIPAEFAATWFKQERPGYVELGSAPDLSGQPITVTGPFGRLTEGSLLPLPAARYLFRDHGVNLHVTWALVWPKKRHGRRLNRWAELFAGAREFLEAAVDRGEPGAEYALAVNKMIYAAYLGGMLRSNENNALSTLRPDWWDQLVPQAGVNQLRALDKGIQQGSIPIGAMKDSVWFVGKHAPLRPAGLEVHTQPGKWSSDRWGEVTQQLIDAHKQEQPALVRDAVIALNKARETEEAAA